MDTVTKTQNRKAALTAFKTTALLSSTEVANATGLSRSTAHRAIEFLRKKNLVLVSGKRSSNDASGKKPLLLCLNANYRYVLCFQIQIAGLSAGITDLKGRILAETSIAFQPDTTLPVVLSHMETMYAELRAQLNLADKDFAGMAVGCNGVVDSEKGIIVSSPNFPSWGNQVPLVNQLRERFMHIPYIYIDNSNRFAAYAEYCAGQAKGIPNFLVIDGHYDGFGGGLVVEGSLWRGRQSLAGEIGHLPVDATGSHACACGARGCLEATASMKALEEAARAGAAKNGNSLLFSQAPASELNYKKVLAAANSGDKYAQSLVSDQAKWLAMGMNSIALLFAPDLIILQGNFKEGGAFLLQSVRKHIEKLGLPRIADKVEVVYSHLGSDRCLIGQAHFIADAYFDNSEIYQ
jgi:Transcriptional regulator/sugar kinase